MSGALPAGNRAGLSRGAIVSGIEFRRVGFGSLAQFHDSIQARFLVAASQKNSDPDSAPTELSESDLPSNELSHCINSNTSHS
jgi:hypothetical protein